MDILPTGRIPRIHPVRSIPGLQCRFLRWETLRRGKSSPVPWCIHHASTRWSKDEEQITDVLDRRIVCYNPPDRLEKEFQELVSGQLPLFVHRWTARL
jgi:hypothetical protein